MRAVLAVFFLFAVLPAPVRATGPEDTGMKLVAVLNAPDSEKHYFGTEVSFEGQNAPATDVLRLIADSSRLNFIWDDDVEALRVSLSVRHLPWDQLFEVVVRQKNLKVIISGTVVQVLTADRFIQRLQQRKTLNGSPESDAVKLAVIPVAYADAKGMAHLLKELLPTTRPDPSR